MNSGLHPLCLHGDYSVDELPVTYLGSLDEGANPWPFLSRLVFEEVQSRGNSWPLAWDLWPLSGGRGFVNTPGSLVLTFPSSRRGCRNTSIKQKAH